jgi:hypothetical protein
MRLRDRKIGNIVQTSPDLVATGNIGCIAQIASGTSIPVLHTIELLDFAHGGQPRLASRALRAKSGRRFWGGQQGPMAGTDGVSKMGTPARSRDRDKAQGGWLESLAAKPSDQIIDLAA